MLWLSEGLSVGCDYTPDVSNAEHPEDASFHELKIRRAVYDSLSCRFFEDKDNVADFYNATHPEEPPISADDVEIVTLRGDRGVTVDYYNDCGFVVRGKLVVILEVQTKYDRMLGGRIAIYSSRTLINHYGPPEKFYSGDGSVKAVEAFIIYLSEDSRYDDCVPIPSPAGGVRATVIRELHRTTRTGEMIILLKRIKNLERSKMSDSEYFDAILGIIDGFEEDSVLKPFLKDVRGDLVDSALEWAKRSSTIEWFREWHDEELEKAYAKHMEEMKKIDAEHMEEMKKAESEHMEEMKMVKSEYESEIEKLTSALREMGVDEERIKQIIGSQDCRVVIDRIWVKRKMGAVAPVLITPSYSLSPAPPGSSS